MQNVTIQGCHRLRITNVVKSADTISQRMWNDLKSLIESADTREQLKSDMQVIVSEIETICGQHDTSPASLATPSRRAYCWLKFLTVNDNLLHHLIGLACGKSAIAESFSQPERVEVHMANMNSIWRRKTRGKSTSIRLNEAFLHADITVWRELMKSTIKKVSTTEKGVINEYIESEDFSGALFEMESLAEPLSASTGHVHNLDESFDRVNASYFNATLPKPKLRWNNVPTTRKFGHYESARDTVMLSISLDEPNVPQHVVDYVMYHELLHKKLGVKLVNGRRMAHTSIFKKAERRFASYKDSMAKLNALARSKSTR